MADPQTAVTPQPPGRRERRRRETRERLFRVALRLFADRGFSATTVADITGAADVGKGTFFNYFPSKEHILAAFGDMHVGKVQVTLAAARNGEASPRQLLYYLPHSLAEEPGKSPALVRSLLAAILSSDAVREHMRRNLDRGRELLAQLMAIGQKQGEIRTDRDPAELARLFQQTLFGTLLLWSLGPSPDLAERLNTTSDLVWSGIAASPARRRTA